MKKITNHKILDFKPNKIIYGFYYCNDKIVKYSKNGDMYLDVSLSDDKSSIYAKIWRHSDYFNRKFSIESFVAVKGKVVKYRERLELNVFNINTVDSELYNRYGFKDFH